MAFDVEAAAQRFAEAHRQHRQMAPPSPAPGSVAEAYAIQDRIAALLGPVGGWKVGASSPTDATLCAPLLAGLMRVSPATWPASSFHMIGAEAELAFRIGRDLPARSGPTDRDELLAAVDTVHAAIEIVDTRLVGYREADPLWRLADLQNNGGFLHDPAGVPFTGQALTDAPYRLLADGRVLKEGRGGNPGGDPVRLLLALLDHAVRERGGVLAGTLITTGAFSGNVPVEPGVTVVAEFPGIGRAEVALP